MWWREEECLVTIEQGSSILYDNKKFIVMNMPLKTKVTGCSYSVGCSSLWAPTSISSVYLAKSLIISSCQQQQVLHPFSLGKKCCTCISTSWDDSSSVHGNSSQDHLAVRLQLVSLQLVAQNLLSHQTFVLPPYAPPPINETDRRSGPQD